ncbi:MAG: hypothetical protein ACTFAL_02740 [Candidatus Electronema sp. V4]|uniref:hypothetical protein n=1 Tax=Candidatus Electronema sp. V4 TaxID=3454756 RepID=UPI0040559A98
MRFCQMMEQMQVSGQEENRQTEKQGVAVMKDKRGNRQQNKDDDRYLFRQQQRSARADAEDEAGRDRQEDVMLAPAEDGCR